MPLSDEVLFMSYRATRDPRVLGEVFDRVAPELLQVAGFLCAGDRSLVEDALQATFLTAITEAERFDAGRRLRPWLLGILANHVRRERRLRRPDHRPAAEDLPSLRAGDAPVAAAADAELRAVLERSLARVRAPYREVLVLHLCHGLDSLEISRALDRPASTVRTHIARGLELLRAVLPAGVAGGVVLAVAPEVLAQTRAQVLRHAPPALAGSSGASSAVSLGGGRRWFMFATLTAALTLVPGLVWWLLAAAEPAGAGAPAVAVMSRPEAATEAVATASMPAEARVPVPQPPVVAPVPRARPLVIEVVCGEAAGPVVGAAVAVARYLPGWPTGQGPQDVVCALTDAAGQAVFPGLDADVPCTAFLVGSDISAVFQEGDALARRLVAAGGADLAIAVVDGQGQPVPEATVVTSGGAGSSERWLELGHTDDHGHLRVAFQTSSTQLVAWARGRAHSVMKDLTLYPGRDNRCTLTLDQPGYTVDGQVTDPRQKPVAGALVAAVPMATWAKVPVFAWTDARGEFRFEGLPAGHLAVVAQRHGEGGPLVGLVRTDIREQTRLAVPATAGGSVRGRTGLLQQPGGAMTTATVTARLLADAIHQLPLLTLYGVAHNGSYRLDGLVPGRWQLTARFGRNALEQVVVVRAGETCTWDPELPETTALKVLVQDAQGRPLAGWQVAPRNRWGFPDGSAVVTDAKGEAQSPAWLYPVADLVPIALHAPLPDGAFVTFPTVVTVPLAVREPLVVTVADAQRPLRHLRGRLRLPSGQPPRDAKVTLRSPRASGLELAAGADGERGFVAGPIPPGRYQVAVDLPGLPTLELGEVPVPADADVDLGEIPVGALGSVRVQLANQPAVPGLELVLLNRHGQGFWLRRQGDATFRARVPFGHYVLRGHAPAWHVAAREVVVDREAAVELEVAPAPCPTLTLNVVLREDGDRSQSGWNGTLLVRDAQGQLILRTQLDHQFHGHWQAQLPFRLGLPAGSYDLELRSWHQAISLGRAVVGESGGTAELRVP